MKLVLIYRPRRDGRLSWPWVAGWLHTKRSVRHLELNLGMVAHLSTNQARRRFSLLIEANALTTIRQTTSLSQVNPSILYLLALKHGHKEIDPTTPDPDYRKKKGFSCKHDLHENATLC